MNGNGANIRTFRTGPVEYAVVTTLYDIDRSQAPDDGLASGFQAVLMNALDSVRTDGRTNQGEWEVISHDMTMLSENEVLVSVIFRRRN